MKRVLLAIVPLPAVWCLVAGALAAKPPEFAQATRVEGKLPISLAGAWLLYVQAQFASGMTRALAPQLISVSQKDAGDLGVQILDVQMPKSIDEPYKAANRNKKAWEPTPADLALLRKQWSKLPPATKKDWRASEFLYDRVEFTVAAPEKYAEVFSEAGSGVQEALTGSMFALRVVEKYRPHPVPEGEKVAQVMERKSIYVVRRANDSMLEGKQFTGYMAAGPGVPIPITLTGPFKLYRLAAGKPATPAKAAKPSGQRPARR